MKTRSILFNGEMVRAILDGRKTQTRRVVKSPLGRYGCSLTDGFVVTPMGHDLHITSRDNIVFNTPCGGLSKAMQDKILVCPYGQSGDRLWVRETWQCYEWLKEKKHGHVCYRASGCSCDWYGHVWRPSIHMPRWASRITLEVTGVRVERVQEITEEDSIAEGIFKHHGHASWTYTWDATLLGQWYGMARYAFHALWDSINAKRGYGWDANPWVWVVEFCLL